MDCDINLIDGGVEVTIIEFMMAEDEVESTVELAIKDGIVAKIRDGNVVLTSKRLSSEEILHSVLKASNGEN